MDISCRATASHHASSAVTHKTDGSWRVAFCCPMTCLSIKVCWHGPELSHLWSGRVRATQRWSRGWIIQHLAGMALASFSSRWCCRVQMSLHSRLWCCRVHIFKYERPERPSLPQKSACGKHFLSSVRDFRKQPVERGSQYVAWKQLLPHPACAGFYLFALRGSYLTLLPNFKG